MPSFTLTPAQVATLLDELALVADVGSPLHSVPSATALPTGHPERQALLEVGALVADGDGDRPNLAIASALRACAFPDEVIWLGAGAPNTSVTVCRRGRLFVDCSPRSDHRLSLTFPLDRAQLVLLATASLSGDRPEPPPSGFAFRGPPSDLLLLRILCDLAGDRPVERVRLVDQLAAALGDPARTVAIGAYGQRADFEQLAQVPARLDEAVARLTSAGHLLGWEPSTSTPGSSGVRLSPTTAATLTAARVASLGVGRRVIETGADGRRRLRERRFRVERRDDRLLTLQVVPIGGEPHVELVERTRAEVRSLVGVFLLGEVWERVASSASATSV